MKKRVLAVLCLLFLVAGCSKENKTEESSKMSSANTTVAETETIDNSSMVTSTVGEATKETTGDEAVDYPYEVSVDKIGTFVRNGMNIPERISFTFEDGAQGIVTFTIKTPDEEFTTSYSVVCQQVPTKPIRIFSAANNEIRTVNVNTELVLGNQIHSDKGHTYTGSLYAFANKTGGISLATPNYAGNVPDENRDVMLEYLLS